MRVSDVSIGTRLGAAFSVMVLLICAVGGIGLQAMHSLKADIDSITQVHNQKVQLNYQMSEQVHIIARVMRSMIILDDAQEQETQFQKILVARERYATAWQALTTMPTSTEGQALRDRIEQGRQRSTEVNERMLAYARASDRDSARSELISSSIPSMQAWLDAVADNVALQQEATTAAVAQASSQFTRGWVGIAIGSVLAAVVAALGGWWMTRSITRPIHYVRQCALRMAAGDLTTPVERRAGFDGRDETSQLVSAMQTMHDSLADMVMTVQSNAASVSAAAEQISSGTSDLSSRTEQQAASLEQTAATMDQLTTTVDSNRESTAKVVHLASGAAKVAAQGGEVMQQVVSTMRGIDGSSKRIADIIGVIDGIAFQTNILALNAAVEAARAGESGRGFAVVAGEVRSLAQRSAAAAREIKQLIGQSVEQVDTGTRLVEEAGDTMAQIVEAIARVNALMAEVKTASNEQGSGISQVGVAISQMDQTTQQNAALVEQSAAASESLHQQARQLMTQVSRFRLVGQR